MTQKNMISIRSIYISIYIRNSQHFGQSSSSLPPFSKRWPILVSLGLEPCTHQDTLHWMHPREHLPHTNLMEKPTCESRISMCQWHLQKHSLVIKTQVDTFPPKTNMKPLPSRNEQFEKTRAKTPFFAGVFFYWKIQVVYSPFRTTAPTTAERKFVMCVFPTGLRSSACRSSLKVRSSLRKTSIEASEVSFGFHEKNNTTPDRLSGRWTTNIAMAGISPFCRGNTSTQVKGSIFQPAFCSFTGV